MRPRFARRAWMPLLALIVCAQANQSCTSDKLTGSRHTNTAPKVWLAVAPPSASTVSYKVHLFWNGFDADGTISHYEFAITDNDTGMFDPADTTGASAWTRTTVMDSVFSFTADQISDSSTVDFDKMNPYEFVRTHTFFIRSVDEEGAVSVPAYRSFTARNLSPVINIETPKGGGPAIAIVPPIITFKWSGKDFIGSRDEEQPPHSVRSIMLSTLRFGGRIDEIIRYVRETPNAEEWTKWFRYDAPGDSGRFWRPEAPLAYGSYFFAVQARDEVGAVSPVMDLYRNIRLFRVQDKITGPSLYVSNRFMGTVSTSTVNTPITTLQVPSGIPVVFQWSADASGYGGTVHSYRYGWDMSDLNKEEEWEVSFTPFVGSYAQSTPRRFFFGSHKFHVEVNDNSGAKSRVPIVVNVVPFTMERPLLFVDDWYEGTQQNSFNSTRGAEPSDAEQDAFWADALRNVNDFSSTADAIPYGTALLTEIPIATLAHYRTLIVNTRSLALYNSPATVFEPLVRYDGKQLNLIKMFMEAGGKVLICGDHAMTMVLNKTIFRSSGGLQQGIGPSYPLIFRYEIAGDQYLPYQGQQVGVLGVGETSFAYDDCCLNVIDQAYGVLSGKWRIPCSVKNVRTYSARDVGLRACLPIDADYDFPRLELRPEVAAPGKWFAENQFGYHTNIFNPPYFAEMCDLSELTPPRECFQPMYGLECLDTGSAVFGAPVAFWTSRYAKVPDPNGFTGRSAVLGFAPVYFKPDQFREALEIILFDEWQLTRETGPGRATDAPR